ncbi:MAG: FeoB-associated Cys-rich membrane protein [Desulfosarcina sp.]|nr:FeoB-associated Cys-rich membrane protein [Desulfosarcina sp.]MBC2744780.1 FeoB-associated Cys-rich membrane protein [Desulfosarcina sp.]MBC2767688.1 FeoB-associated Cys-rich membrane protein [Desulfosarcina sp.]
METLIVIFIVVAAAAYVGRTLYKGFKQKDGCASGCTCCSISDSCSEPAAKNARDASCSQADR